MEAFKIGEQVSFIKQREVINGEILTFVDEALCIVANGFATYLVPLKLINKVEDDTEYFNKFVKDIIDGVII